MVVGWYHSHPGFGCWLSGVDINTQQSFEALNARAVAVVVDPVQSVKVRRAALPWGPCRLRAQEGHAVPCPEPGECPHSPAHTHSSPCAEQGKVVIDAFRLISTQTMMLGYEPRQTTSNLGALNKPSIQVGAARRMGLRLAVGGGAAWVAAVGSAGIGCARVDAAIRLVRRARLRSGRSLGDVRPHHASAIRVPPHPRLARR